MAPISLLIDVLALLVTKSNLRSDTLAAPTVGGLVDTSAELLQSFAKETLTNAIRLLVLDHTIELLLLKKSLKESHDGLDGLIIECFPTQNNFSR